MSLVRHQIGVHTRIMGTLGQPQWDDFKIRRTFSVSVCQYVCLPVHGGTISRICRCLTVKILRVEVTAGRTPVRFSDWIAPFGAQESGRRRTGHRDERIGIPTSTSTTLFHLYRCAPCRPPCPFPPSIHPRPPILTCPGPITCALKGRKEARKEGG